MDLIYYLFARLILFCVLYTLDLLPYYLLIANGAGGVGILNFSYFNVLYRSYRVNNKVIDVLCILMYCYTGILFVVLGVFYTQVFCRKHAVTRANDQGVTNLYGSVVLHVQHRLVLFLGSSKCQAGSFNR